jgi:hypothetical protein
VDVFLPDLTTEQLSTLLAELDEAIRQARELSDHIKTRLDERRDANKSATNWDRRNHPERRKRPRA